MEGYQLTWTNSLGTPDSKEVWHGRALATQSWIDYFPMHRLVNGISDKSDHSPIWLRLADENRRPMRKPFRFENVWLDEPELTSIVADSWRSNEGLDFMSKISH